MSLHMESTNRTTTRTDRHTMIQCDNDHNDVCNYDDDFHNNDTQILVFLKKRKSVCIGDTLNKH